MVKKREVPARADLIDYRHSVAGQYVMAWEPPLPVWLSRHTDMLSRSAGTMCDADGELFIKPCTQQELDFYNAANAKYPDFAALMPSFVGSLMLNDAAELNLDDGLPGGPVDSEIPEQAVKALQAQAADAVPETSSGATAADGAAKDNVTWVPNMTKKIKTDLAVVLENASHGFSHANIMDAKLGKRLWADDAPQQKKTRFDKISSETTHGSLGFRIAGMRVYRGSLDKAELDEEDFRCYDKDYGRTSVNDGNIVDAFKRFVFAPAAGVSRELGQAVAAAFVQDLRNVEEVLLAHESRMYSASLLFVFEGDGETLRAAIEANNAAAEEAEQRITKGGQLGDKNEPGRPSSRVDSGIALMDGDTPDDSFDDDDDESEAGLPSIYRLKLIDFAHAEWTPGQGPDENALMGVRSLIRIFEEIASS